MVRELLKESPPKEEEDEDGKNAHLSLSLHPSSSQSQKQQQHHLSLSKVGKQLNQYKKLVVQNLTLKSFCRGARTLPEIATTTYLPGYRRSTASSTRSEEAIRAD